jgi:hypothetical protein
MQNEVTERDRDGNLMSLDGRHSDCGDARWTPRHRDSQVVVVNIKVNKLYKIYAGPAGTAELNLVLRRPWHFAAPLLIS